MEDFNWSAFAKKHKLTSKQLKEVQDFVILVSSQKGFPTAGWWYEIVAWDDWDFGYMLFYDGKIIALTLGIYSNTRQAVREARRVKEKFSHQYNKKRE